MKILGRFLVLPVCLAVAARAQLLSVDINKSEAPRSDDTAPGFAGWYDVNTSAQTTAHTFTNFSVTLDTDTGIATTNVTAVIGCTLTQTFPAPGNGDSTFNADWEAKKGNNTSTDPNAGFRLSEDGVWVKSVASGNPTNGGAFTLSITGLAAGTHTITTYHNSIFNQTWVNAANPNLSRCIISASNVVNSGPVFTNTPSLLVSNDFKCGFAFFSVNYADTNSPLVISFAPDGSAPQDFVILNGFEIDRPNAPGTTATALFPTPSDEHVFANNDIPLPGTTNSGSLTLQWLPSGFAISNYVYFGTSSNAVLNATPASPEFKSAFAVVTNPVYVVTNSFNVTNLNSALTYFWRVDQLDFVNGATNLAKGNVWEFRTRHLAFPTAEGYGRWARGGRGGVVIEVTNLNDSGPGSYRAAVAANGPRTVVFKVSGLIRLQSPCVIGNGYLYVAGQTAPGDGICLANWRAGMTSCNDVIMRFMRCRLGDASQQAMDGIGLGNSSHSILDHCSISWTMDEATSSRQSGSVGSQSAMISNQHNLIAEPLQYSYHYDASNRTNCEPHAFAGSISGEIGSYHHNLIAHSTDRNWSLAGGLDQQSHYAGSLDIRNNVVYNFTGRTTDGGVARLNYVNNFYKPAPANASHSPQWLFKLDTIVTNWGTETYYMTGNVMIGTSYYTNNWTTGSFVNGLPLTNVIVTNSDIYPSYVDTQTASNAYKLVLSDVGANLPAPDAIDRRLVGEVLDGTTHYTGTNNNPYIILGVSQPKAGSKYAGFIDSQNDVKDFQSTNSAAANYSANAPWPPYATYNVPLDSDHDGLPNWWEQMKGFNTNSPPGDFSDANGDPDGDGYSNLEDYLTWLAAPHFDCTNGTPLTIDLSQLTRGFTNLSPVYALLGVTNGAAGLSGRVVSFTNFIPTNQLGSFRFKVTDSQSFSYTNTVGIHLVPSNAPNSAPYFTGSASNRTINAGVNLFVTNLATDGDAGQTLTYTLPVKPTNATIGAVSGVLNWRPLVSQANSTNPFTVVVTDNGSPNLSATQNFSVVVNPLALPGIAASPVAAGQMGFSVSGQAGPDYAVQGSSNLLDWNTLFITNPATMPFNWSTNIGVLPAQYYRIKVGPPLP
jgi:hypothetical protein